MQDQEANVLPRIQLVNKGRRLQLPKQAVPANRLPSLKHIARTVKETITQLKTVEHEDTMKESEQKSRTVSRITMLSR